MERNCLGIEVPDQVVAKAKEHGCLWGARYVYRDGEYGGGSPKASIGCERATPFTTGDWESCKVTLAPGWVAFRSPSHAKRSPGSLPSRVPGKEGCEPCLICGEDRFTEGAHFPTPDRHGGTETIPLCPTHHRLLDNGRLSDWELLELCRKKYGDLGFTTPEQFVTWAYGRAYPYSYADMRAKAFWSTDASPREISYRIENLGS